MSKTFVQNSTEGHRNYQTSSNVEKQTTKSKWEVMGILKFHRMAKINVQNSLVSYGNPQNSLIIKEFEQNSIGSLWNASTWMDGWMNGCTDVWMDGWMYGCVDGCMDVWMDV